MASQVPTQANIQSTHPFTCNTCQVAFRSSELQRAHMQTDWHRYNLKRRVASLPPLSSEIFTEKVLANKATAAATAAKASFEKSCTICQKTYFSENAYNNHLNSQKHRTNVMRAGRGVQHDDAASVTGSMVSSAFSLGESMAESDVTVNGETEKEFSEVVDGMKNASLDSEPVHGGRKRPDGMDVKWAVTFPKGNKGGQNIRGRVPFFCHDTTPRNVRVPVSGESTTHPCAALGVRQLTVITKDKTLLNETRQAYASIFGNDGTARGDEVIFQTTRVHDVKGLEHGAQIVLRLPKDKREFDATTKVGYSYGDVVLSAKAGSQGTHGTKKRRLDDGREDVGGLWIEYV